MGVSLYSVDIALAESLNAIWKHAKIHKDLKTEDVRSAVQDLTVIYDRVNILEARELSEEAMDIALTQNISIYDSLYIAAAKKTESLFFAEDLNKNDVLRKVSE